MATARTHILYPFRDRKHSFLSCLQPFFLVRIRFSQRTMRHPPHCKRKLQTSPLLSLLSLPDKNLLSFRFVFISLTEYLIAYVPSPSALLCLLVYTSTSTTPSSPPFLSLLPIPKFWHRVIESPCVYVMSTEHSLFPGPHRLVLTNAQGRPKYSAVEMLFCRGVHGGRRYLLDEVHEGLSSGKRERM